MRKDKKKMSAVINVLKAKSTMTDLIGAEDEEHMYLDPHVDPNVEVGQQVRIRVKDASTKCGIYTVIELYEDGPDNNDGRQGWHGRKRLDQEDDSYDAYLEGVDQVVLNGKTDSWLQSNNEYGEDLQETNSTHSNVFVGAPHGGLVENYTDEMSGWFYDQMVNTHSEDCTRWYCRGWQSAVDAYDAWHVKSTLISPKSFPKLDDIKDRDFSYTVSFHGCGEEDIIIGGKASSTLKNNIKSAIEAVVGQDYDVTIADSSSPYAGQSDDNFINWLCDTSQNSIQVELPYGARQTYGQGIAEAVADEIADVL